MNKNIFQDIITRWNRFFFEPISTATIGIFRIVFAITIFISILGKYPCRELFYGEMGLVRYETMTQYFPFNPILFFRWVPSGDPALKYYFLGILVSVIALIFGFCTRISSILVFLGLMSLSNRNFFVDNSGDDLMRINSLILMFSEAGAAFSIDRWLKIKRGLGKRELPLRSPWAQRLLQLQLAFLYIDTFYLKLPGEGWRDGTALYYAINCMELRRFTFKYLFYYLWQIKVATYSALLIEFSLATLVWFRKFRYWVLAIGALFHFGINLVMQFPVFQYVMIASLINFIYPEDIERVLLKLEIKKGAF